MPRLSLSDIPYVEASQVGSRHRPSLIVLTSTFSDTRPGVAYAAAFGAHSRQANWSAHFTVDADSTYRCLDLKMAGFHATDNRDSLGVRLCDDPSASPARWDEPDHAAMLARTADLVARLCLLYGIRPCFLSDLELSKWRKWHLKRRGGIVIQGDMSLGHFPRENFLALVEVNIAKYKYINDK